MTDQKGSDQKDSNGQSIGLGARLRETREARKWSVVDVAERLNLEPDVIDALENEHYEKLPERTFIRGYLLAYLKLAGLPESLIREFESNDQVKEYVPLSSARGYKTTCSRDGWVKCINAGLVVLLIAAVTIWLLEQQFHWINPVEKSQPRPVATAKPANVEQVQPPQSIESDNNVNPLADFTPEEDSEPAVATEITDVMTEAEESVPVQAPDDEVTIVVDETQATLQEEQQVEQQAEQQQESGSLVDQEIAEHTLLLRFSDTSWAQVKDADDKTLLNGTFNGGEEKFLSGKPPFSFIVGRIRNISIEYNGNEVDLTQHNAGVARFSVGDPAGNDGG